MAESQFVRGMLGAQQNAQQQGMSQLQALGMLSSLQNQQRQQAMDEQTNPLKMRLMEAQVSAAENPAPVIKDAGGYFSVLHPKTFQEIGRLPKTASPDATLREAGSDRRHNNPSGSSLLGAETTMRGQDLTDARTRSEGAANRGVSIRGQDLTNTRALETGARERVPAGYRAIPGGLEPIPGGPSTNKAQSSDVERTSAGYATRMTEAGKIMGGLEQQGIGKPGFTESVAATVPGVGKMASNAAMSPERQQYRQAQEDWVRAKLRKESGAVIADEEMDREIRVYFPQIGDSPQVIKQKSGARALAESGMSQAAGRAMQSGPQRRRREDVLLDADAILGIK